MNFMPRIVSLSLISITLAGLLVACGEKGRQYAKVDVAAQIEQLKSPDPVARQDACVALGSAGPNAASAVPHLAQALKDSDTLVRSLAAYALGEIGPAAKEAIPALHVAVNDPEPTVVPSAVNALRAIDPATYGALTVPEIRKLAPR
jgi:HEAT repeat protein